MNPSPVPSTAQARHRSFMARGLVRLLTVAAGLGAAGVVGLLAALYSLQARIIFPGSSSQGRPEAQLTPRADAQLLTLPTPSGGPVVALFGAALTKRGTPRPDAAGRPTLLYFYGNGSCLKGAEAGDFDEFRRLGLNVLIPDYLGYGMSGGSPSEGGCYETADVCYAHLMTCKDIDPRKIVVAGRSLGGGVAIDLAARRDVAGLVAFCTFTSMSDMTRKQYPIAPTALLRHKFDSLSKIDRVSCPILLGHGRLDTLVPSSMSETLAAAARTPVTSFVVEGAEHNDFYQVGGPQIYEALESFVNSQVAK